MKRLSVILSAILILCVSVVFSACGETARLPAPANLYVDDDENLNWSEVQDAYSYELEITPQGGTPEVRPVRRNTYGLRTLAVGDYDFRIRALGSGELSSDWSAPVSYQKLPDYGYVYKALDDGTAWILSSARSSTGEISLEDTYRGKPIVQIGDGAFRNNREATSVTVGKYVRALGERVFYNCVALSSVNLPDSILSMGGSVFYGCSVLESVKLPAQLTSVPEYTFAYCSALKTVEFPANVLSIGESAFYSCSSLEEISIPDSVLSIDRYAFSKDEKLTSVTVGAGMQSIGIHAFSDNKLLTTVKFAENYESLTFGSNTFTGCPELVSFAFPAGTTAVPNACFDGDAKLAEVTIPESVTDVGVSAFRNTKLVADQEGKWTYADKWLISVPQELQKALTKLTPQDFREDIIGIGYGVFMTSKSGDDETRWYGCTSLQEVELPRSLRYIGMGAFYGCPFYKLTLEQDPLLESIGQQAFRDCTALYNLQLTNMASSSSNLKTIENYAFYGCLSLSNNVQTPELIVPASVTHVGQRVFEGTPLYENSAAGGLILAGNWVVGFNAESGVTMVELSENIVGIADYSFAYDTELLSIEGTSHVRYIGEGAFMDCEGLKQVRLNRNITKIAPFTFAQCIALTDVGELPMRIDEIGDYAFFQCDSLQSIDLSSTLVKRVGAYAYYSCEAAQNIVLPEGLTEIGPYAFYHNTVTELSIPDSVTSIGSHAFTLSEGLTSLAFGEESKLEYIGDYAFRSSTKLQTLVLPDSLETIGYAAFFQCGLTDVNFGSGLKQIGGCAFAMNANLPAAQLPQGIEYIGDCAFLYCFSLRSVVLPESLSYVGSYAFYGCMDASFYSTLESVPLSWSQRWNPTFRPMLWGVTLSEEGYVISIHTEGIVGGMAQGGIAAPEREGYEFLGWATQENATAAEYQMSDLPFFEEETTLYAVYGPKTAEPEDPSEPAEDIESPSGQTDQQ